jgi:hypothetical protein
MLQKKFQKKWTRSFLVILSMVLFSVSVIFAAELYWCLDNPEWQDFDCGGDDYCFSDIVPIEDSWPCHFLCYLNGYWNELHCQVIPKK